MRLRDQLLLAESSLRGHPLRAFLTTLGMIVGVAAVVAMVSIGLGARHQIENEIARLGTNLLTVQPVSQTTDGLKGSQPGKHQLSEGDARVPFSRDCSPPPVRDSLARTEPRQQAR